MSHRPIAYIGVDPGLSGAMALVHPRTTRSRSWDLPVLKVPAPGNKRTKAGRLRYRSHLDEAAILDALQKIQQECRDCDLVAVIEAVSPQRHRGQGGATISEGPLGAFNFGASWGLVRGLIRSVCPYVLVYPVSWRTKLLGVGASKAAAIREAGKLYPYLEFPRKKDEHRAEALLLATYGKTHMQPVYAGETLTTLIKKTARI